jgi:hypothetical protein
MGADHLEAAPFGILLAALPHRFFLPGTSACLSPRFYPHSFGSADPLLDGVPRFGGALSISATA